MLNTLSVGTHTLKVTFKDGEATTTFRVIEKSSGGGFFSDHTDEEYKAAGVELVFANWFGNWGYKFQGVEIDLKKANALVKFYQNFGRPAESITECYRYYRNEMNSK